LIIDYYKRRKMMTKVKTKGVASLADLKVGESGKVREVLADKAMRQKIMDMGITKGATVAVSKKSPLGDPLEVKARNYKITIRKKSAEGILL
jgi:ferrous iron transport protein A